MKYRIPLAQFKATDKQKALVLSVLDSGTLSYGPISQKFEALFSQKHGCKYGVVSNSGTSSLQVALAALKEYGGWEDGDEVIVPATTFVATANVVLMNNLRPVFVDIEDTTYGMDPDLVEQAIGPKTRAIIPVHLFGIPCQMDRIMPIAQKHGLRVIEDSCETVCASIDGKSVGSFGDIGVFSFYACHPVCAGIGGMATTNNKQLNDLMRSMVNHGRGGGFINGLVSDAPPDQRFLFERLGYSYRITEIEAALALAQTENLWSQTSKRIYAGYRVGSALRQEFGDMLHIPLMERSSYMMFPVLLTEHALVGKAYAMQALEDAGIETREMLPLLSQPFYVNQGHDLTQYPVSQRVKDRGFYFGIYPEMDIAEIRHIVKTFEQVLCKRPVNSRGNA